MSSRDDILARIRAHKPRLDRPLPVVPLFDERQPPSLLAAFKESPKPQRGGPAHHHFGEVHAGTGRDGALKTLCSMEKSVLVALAAGPAFAQCATDNNRGWTVELIRTAVHLFDNDFRKLWRVNSPPGERLR